MTSIEKARVILTSFPGRSDCYGMDRGACVKEPLTQAIVIRHILGRQRIGRYLLLRDGRIGALALDVDVDDLSAVIEYRELCERYELVTHVERSKAKGYHLWLFFANLVSARKARLVASYILNECDLSVSIEIFPKQDLLRPGGYGNYINLPQFGRDVERKRTVFLNPRNGYEPYTDQWAFLASRERVSEAQLDRIVELNNLNRQRSSRATGKEDRGNGDYRHTGLPCFSAMMREGADEGMRNEATLRLSVQLYRVGIPRDLALTMMREWNSKRNRPPLGEAELVKAVSNGYLGIYGHGCFSGLIRRYCDPSCPIFRRHNRAGREPRQAGSKQR